MTAEPILHPNRVETMNRAGLWAELTLHDCLQRTLDQHPQDTAIIDHNSVTGQRTAVSYQDLNDRSERIAAGLWLAGLRRGDVVSIQLPNWWQFAALHLACVRLGAITNPLMPIFRERELSFMLNLAETKFLVVPEVFRGYDHATLGHSLKKSLPHLKDVYVIESGGSGNFERELLNADPPAVSLRSEWAAIRPNEVVQILYTSGTTGEPKGVMHTSNTLFSNLTRYAQRMRLTRQDVILMASPLAHQTGFMYGLMQPIYLGCKAVLQDIWNATMAADIVRREKVTYTMASTPFLADMTELANTSAEAFASLRLFHSAGAPIPRALVRDATERLGATIISGWGMTENGAAATTRPDDPPEKIFETDGCAMEGMELRVVDEQQQSLAPGESGFLQVRGCSNFVGYLRRPRLYQTDADGWFSTGDIARLDGDGYLRITGRTKDVVIRGGENVPVVEIENVLYGHPLVREVAIVARADARLGERCAAWVVPRGDQTPTLADLSKYLQSCGVAKAYFPEFIRVVTELPKTPTGKIQKFQLRAMEAQRTE